MEQQKVWYITGASKGFGLLLVKKLLASGERVAATSRQLDALKTAVGSDSPNFLPLAVNLSDEQSVNGSIRQTLSAFGRIDVAVNNAGYGLVGGLEELSDKEVRDNFEVNVFGALNVIRNVMPVFRKQQDGFIFNISSIGGFTGTFPGFGSYCATKFALEGLTESLAAEAKPFGVKAVIVSPGYFRTNFLSSGSLVVPEHPIADYENIREIQTTHQQNIDGAQPGDPEKAVDVIISVSKSGNPPLHLFLGPDAYQLAKQKIAAVEEDMLGWQALATSTNFN
ncbi:SDR family NAD(P)-dependent oxidoreductase [Chitinophaga sp. GCM10012297]|uniref:SDR family NAD(P)-dependent oxidoreductase n=1 Tax=Chitinophaga chungangae TaxID=2821488 RepID=A0ABS3YF55_9BACT|nr:SDR family NAD(P)-dependent oxidoreductase [Chitinophaga chungangae]MBO9153317.1 SDR family NAD(P)-dependent oxidoreductase [Chitinophaga chungangae]